MSEKSHQSSYPQGYENGTYLSGFESLLLKRLDFLNTTLLGIQKALENTLENNANTNDRCEHCGHYVGHSDLCITRWDDK